MKQLQAAEITDTMAVAAWFKQACANSGSVGSTVNGDKALHVAACLGVDNFTGSSGWIDRFKKPVNPISSM